MRTGGRRRPSTPRASSRSTVARTVRIPELSPSKSARGGTAAILRRAYRGRDRAQEPLAGSEFELPLDVAIVALGTTANPLVQSTTPDLATGRGGYITADPETLRTSKRGVFAGGDIVTGAATVILAMGAGRKAARSIHDYLTTGQWNPPGEPPQAPA